MAIQGPSYDQARADEAYNEILSLLKEKYGVSSDASNNQITPIRLSVNSARVVALEKLKESINSLFWENVCDNW